MPKSEHEADFTVDFTIKPEPCDSSDVKKKEKNKIVKKLSEETRPQLQEVVIENEPIKKKVTKEKENLPN